MSGATAQFAISAAAVITGGSVVQLIIAVIRKRSDLAHVDAQSAEIKASIADKVAERLDGLNTGLHKRVAELEKQIAGLNKERDGLVRERAAAAATAEAMARAMALLRFDLSAANAQIGLLEQRLNDATQRRI